MTAKQISQDSPPRNSQITASCTSSLFFFASLLGSLMLFFRYDVFSHFNIVYGDAYDGDIEVSILEHWFNVFRGFSAWSQTFAFYPATGTLGYNDGYFIFGLIYSIARGLGADPFLSSEVVNIVIKLLGFVGFYVLSRRAIGNSSFLSCVGAATCLVSNNSYIQGGHAQLFTVSLAPILAGMLYEAVVALQMCRKIMLAVWLLAASALFAAWLLTAFYMAWFFTLFCGIFLVFVLLSLQRWRLQAVMQQAVICRNPLVISAIVFAVLLIPFFVLYIPRAAETGMHSPAEITEFLLAPSDTLALGGHNLIYNDLLSGMQVKNTEHATGFTPILLLCFLLTACFAFTKLNGGKRHLRSVVLATFTCWTLAIAIDGYSLWTLVYHFVPGAKALRVVSRIQIFLTWPVVTVAVSGLDLLCRTVPRFRRMTVTASVLVALYIVVEQVNILQIPALDRTTQMRWLHSFAPPPSRCKAFFANTARPFDKRYAEALNDLVGFNIDSMLVAEWLSRPTVNGFATFVPPAWDLLSIDKDDYIGRVRRYSDQFGVTSSLCGLNLSTGAWTTTPFAS